MITFRKLTAIVVLECFAGGLAAHTHKLHENLKRIYKSYHPREHQLWCEVDEASLGRLEALRGELERLEDIEDLQFEKGTLKALAGLPAADRQRIRDAI